MANPAIEQEERSILKHCHYCGYGVSTYTVQVGPVAELRCSACGYPVEVRAQRDADGADVIAVVDPNRHVLTFLSRVVTERQLAGEVVTADSGMDFLTLFVERLAAAQPVRLAILGTPMPHLDGLSTALAMRAIERGFPRHEPTPIVFLYPAWTDDPLRGLISLCQPALYLSREGNPEESRLGERINQAVNHLLGLRAV